MIKIISYQDIHQNGINEMMNEIALEFDEQIISKPSKETPEFPDKYWVAINKGKVIGTVGILVINNEFGILKKMMLKKTFRGRKLGISQLMLETVNNWCERNEISKIYLGTMNQLKQAQKFYEKNGFNEISEYKLPKGFQKNPLDKVFYERNLNK